MQLLAFGLEEGLKGDVGGNVVRVYEASYKKAQKGPKYRSAPKRMNRRRRL